MPWSFLTALVLTSAAFRLPASGDFTQPEHYDLGFRILPRQGTFSGEEAIRIEVKGQPAMVVLHAVDLHLSSAVIEQNGRSMAAVVTLHPDTESLELRLPQALAAGSAVIKLSFDGKLRDDLRGLYLVQRPQGEPMVISQFESTDARRAFPCYDEPAFKASYSIRATVPAGLAVISNGAPQSDTPTADAQANLHTLTFADTMPISSYLVALAVGDFAAVEEDVAAANGAIHVRTLAPRGQEQLGHYALGVANEVLPFYARYFGIPYPFGKLDLVAVPDFDAGGMENAGAIFFRENRLLLDERSASAQIRRKIFVYVTHEIAHQWFGDLVTMAWWDDLWLNEAFASLMEGVSLEALHPDWSPWNEFQLDLQAALAVDALTATHPIHVPVASAEEADALFDDITYAKGANVLRMLERYFSPKLWQQAVHGYLTSHRFGNARGEDLWQALSTATGKDAGGIARSWFDHPGFPLVTAHRERAKLTLRQNRFTEAPAGSAGPRWLIPACVEVPKAKQIADRCTLLSDVQGEVDLPGAPAWLDANAHQLGVYRVDYDPSGWSALGTAFDQRRGPSPDASERMAALEDAFALGRAGREPLDPLLDLLSHLSNERDDLVWNALAGTLSGSEHHDGLLQQLDDQIDDPGLRAQLQAFIGRVLKPAADDFGWMAAANDSPARRTARAAVLDALTQIADDPRAAAQAKLQLARFERDPSAVDPGLFPVLLKSAARHGDAALWEHFRQQMDRSTAPELKDNYRVALGAFADPALVQKSLDLIFAGGFPKQEVSKQIAQMLLGRPSRRATLDFLAAHWRELRDRFFGFSANRILLPALGVFCSAADHDRLEALLRDPANHLDGADRAVEQTLERIANCTRTHDAHATQLAQWLKAHPADR